MVVAHHEDVLEAVPHLAFDLRELEALEDLGRHGDTAGDVAAVADTRGANVNRHHRRDQRVAKELGRVNRGALRHDRVAREDVLRTARLGAAVGDDHVDEAGLLLLDDFTRSEQFHFNELAGGTANLFRRR